MQVRYSNAASMNWMEFRRTLEEPDSIYLAPGAMVIGKVQIGKDVNILATCRGARRQ